MPIPTVTMVILKKCTLKCHNINSNHSSWQYSWHILETSNLGQALSPAVEPNVL